MNNFLFAGSLFNSLSKALVRYFSHVLNLGLSLAQSNISVRSNDIDQIFVVNEPLELSNCCRWMYDNGMGPDQLRIMGYDINNDINLLNFDLLKVQFEKKYRSEKTIDRIQIPFFRDQIRLFFKGHGEQSLFQCLTYVRYNLENYSSLLKSGDYTQEGLYQNFLLPGLENWNEFVRRFNKYAPVLYVRGWASETNTIDNLLRIISIDLGKIDTSKSFVVFELESMHLINEIVILLEELAQQQQD